MNDMKEISPVELIQPLSTDNELLTFQSAPAKCDTGIIQATCEPSGIIR